MRITISIEDELVEKAQSIIALMDMTALVREALNALIQRESSKRLTLLGGTEPCFEHVTGANLTKCDFRWQFDKLIIHCLLFKVNPLVYMQNHFIILKVLHIKLN